MKIFNREQKTEIGRSGVETITNYVAGLDPDRDRSLDENLVISQGHGAVLINNYTVGYEQLRVGGDLLEPRITYRRGTEETMLTTDQYKIDNKSDASACLVEAYLFTNLRTQRTPSPQEISEANRIKNFPYPDLENFQMKIGEYMLTVLSSQQTTTSQNLQTESGAYRTEDFARSNLEALREKLESGLELHNKVLVKLDGSSLSIRSTRSKGMNITVDLSEMDDLAVSTIQKIYYLIM